MLVRAVVALYALSCASGAAAQNLEYKFTSGVTSPAPVPGKPFTITWTGGEATEVVYIVLNYYFPDTPDQNIIYGTTNILSNAPNNGSWTYNVPLNIVAGRHSFSIGYNPFQLSDTTDIFTIDASQTSYVAPVSATSNTAAQSYNGCGLPPVPGYTYTGYQPPCTTTISGSVVVIYPVVPSSDSALWYGSTSQAPAPTTSPVATTSPAATTSPTANTAFASGIYAQALQCPTPVTPSTTEITAGATTTIISLVDCNAAVTASASSANGGGVCHTSGYTTFSVSGTSSVCCPNGWATTPLDTELFCFTSTAAPDAKKAALGERQASTETVVIGTSSPVIKIYGLVFTTAGVVAKEATVTTGSTASESSTRSTTAIVTSTTKTASHGVKFGLSLWESMGIAFVASVWRYLIF